MRPALSISSFLFSLPLEFLHWWFIEATFNLLSILQYFLSLSYRFLGISLLFKTFFKPWKNEYREGLTRFALFMGIFIKSCFLLFDLFFFVGLILLESFILITWLILPILVIGGLYASIFP